VNERPAPPPEGQLITAALAKARPKLTLREAARRAEISEARWRQIAQGYVMINGQPSPMAGPAETIARMAHAVGVESFQLREAGRADAADALQDITNELENGSKTPEELSGELHTFAEELRGLLEKRGLDPKSRQMDVLNPAIVGFAETMLRFIEIDDRKP